MDVKRKLVIGDIHGCYKELIDVLHLANFNPEEDMLISLGDLVDRGPDSFRVVEYLMSLPNKICVRGNHDKWWQTYLEQGQHPISFHHGGDKTYQSYLKNCEMDELITIQHLMFFEQQVNYYIDEQNRMFVHGGFNRHIKVKDVQDTSIFYWDRDLFVQALSYDKVLKIPEDANWSISFKTKDNFKKIFVGHTPTVNFNVPNNEQPIKAANIINMDTACCFGYNLTVMDVDTEEFWQVKKQ